MKFPCRCADRSHSIGAGLWHRAYCNWFDRREAGSNRRAAVWGWIADRLVRFA